MTSPASGSGFGEISVESLGFLGGSLERPECVLATAGGDVFTCDPRGIVARVAPNGTESLLGPDPTPLGIKPNGIAMRRDGSFLFANLGREGGVWSLGTDGRVRPFVQEVDGERLPSTNFVWIDDQDRVWICVSTRDAESHDASFRFSPRSSDGFVALVDGRGARIVADGFCWTNECRIDPTGGFLYLNETFSRRLTRFRLGPDGSLSARETVTEFGSGIWPDGLAFDVEGAVWITSIISNRLIRIVPDGRPSLVLEDCDPDEVARVDAIFSAGDLTREVIFGVAHRRIRNLSSLAFGGPDLRTVYLGSLGNRSVLYFRSPVAGLPPSHWAHS